jgi:phage shock protein PspC (stress-responsive transcriptional regulator)
MTEQPQNPNPAPPPQQQPPFHTPPPPGYRRLTRTADDAPISGVCGGVARYLGVDPTVVRVLAVIAAVVTFPVGPIVYAVMWAVMPKE